MKCLSKKCDRKGKHYATTGKGTVAEIKLCYCEEHLDVLLAFLRLFKSVYNNKIRKSVPHPCVNVAREVFDEVMKDYVIREKKKGVSEKQLMKEIELLNTEFWFGKKSKN